MAYKEGQILGYRKNGVPVRMVAADAGSNTPPDYFAIGATIAFLGAVILFSTWISDGKKPKKQSRMREL